MSPGIRYVLDLADPRGRFDRVDLIWAAVTLIAGQIAFALGLWIMNASFLGWRGFLANLVFGWLGYAAISKRLHDLGHSSWWLLGCVLGWLAAALVLALAVALIAGPDALETGTPAFRATCSAVLLPAVVRALWLHLAAGEPRANCYGPAPAHDSGALQPA
jgi:uncharacterized membrane protein YhaH (DUF805 family)